MKKTKKLFNAPKKYSPMLLDVLEKFGLGPALNISGLEKDILDVISQIEDARFYDLCECFDMKPSKMEDHLIDLEEMGLVEYMDAAGKVLLTELAEKYVISLEKKETRSEKKFRKFVESLSDEELGEFAQLADSFVIDPELLQPEEVDNSNFVIVDEEAADDAEAEAAADAEAEAIESAADTAAEETAE